MKTVFKLVLVSVLFAVSSCTEDDSKEAISCYECISEAEEVDVCEEDGMLYVNGEEIDNPHELTLAEFIDLIHENPNNDVELEDLVCTKN